MSYPWRIQVCVTMEKGSPVQSAEQNLLPRGTFLTFSYLASYLLKMGWTKVSNVFQYQMVVE